MSREILDIFWPIFFQFDLYAGQYLVLNSTQLKTINMLLKVQFDLYAGRLIREYIRYVSENAKKSSTSPQKDINKSFTGTIDH